MGLKCLSEMPSSSPDRWQLRYDVGSSLAEVNRLEEAVECFEEVLAHVGHIRVARSMVHEVLEKIVRKCDADEKRLPVQERALRECWELRPYDAATMRKLGHTLCKMEKFEKGNRLLELAEKVPPCYRIKIGRRGLYLLLFAALVLFVMLACGVLKLAHAMYLYLANILY